MKCWQGKRDFKVSMKVILVHNVASFDWFISCFTWCLIEKFKIRLARAIRFDVREMGDMIGKKYEDFNWRLWDKQEEAKSSGKNYFLNSKWLNWTFRIRIKWKIYGLKGSQKIFTVSFIFSNYFWHGSGTFQVWPPSIKFWKYVSVCFTHRHEKA